MFLFFWLVLWLINFLVRGRYGLLFLFWKGGVSKDGGLEKGEGFFGLVMVYGLLFLLRYLISFIV